MTTVPLRIGFLASTNTLTLINLPHESISSQWISKMTPILLPIRVITSLFLLFKGRLQILTQNAHFERSTSEGCSIPCSSPKRRSCLSKCLGPSFIILIFSAIDPNSQLKRLFPISWSLNPCESLHAPWRALKGHED